MIQLKPFQFTALSALEDPASATNHILCVSPTGSGKSLIYERAAAVPGRRTLLITPLIALARQQFKKLRSLGIPVRMDAGGRSEGPPFRSGAWIMSPEMLNFDSKKLLLNHWRPNFLVVDECHCLWEWGEKFRPAFSLIPELLQSLAIQRSIWLTATLPYEARIQLRQVLPKTLTELGQFDLPPQLRLSIHRVNWEERAQVLIHWVNKLEGAGIIFVPTRESTLRVGRLIQALGKKVISYHGGMSAEERKNAENQIASKIPEVIVATSAFGMGMDYSHLKYVILWQAPTSLLSLVQTVGRVGRNETVEGHAIVLWDPEDFRLLEWTVAGSDKRRRELKDLIQFLENPACRKIQLKHYFDQVQDSLPCHRCDFCQRTGG